MTQPRAILLDLDNTAYPYTPCHEAGLRAAYALAERWHPTWKDEAVFRADYDRARGTVKRHVGACAAAHCRLLYFKTMIEDRLGRTSLAAATDLHEGYWRGYAGPLRADPGCLELLQEFRAANFRLAWVTNFTTARQMWKLQLLGLAEVADRLVTSEEAGAEKPDPACLKLALDRLGVHPENAWLVGDSLTEDRVTAAAVGVRYVWFRRGDEPVPEPPPMTVASWPALRELLDVRRYPRPT